MAHHNLLQTLQGVVLNMLNIEKGHTFQVIRYASEELRHRVWASRGSGEHPHLLRATAGFNGGVAYQLPQLQR